jgi:hypothetical protein
MARKGGKRGGNSAARSAAAKKGWETRRRGGSAAKGKGTQPTAASKPKGKQAPTASRKAPPPPAWSAAMKAAAARKQTGGKPANNISASPRRLNAAERAYIDITTGKGKSKFRSDKKVREEMQRRGFLTGKDAQGDLITIASRARRKRGGTY